MNITPSQDSSGHVSGAQSNSRLGGFIELLIQYRRLVFSLVMLLMAVGLLALGSMARQEDPSFPYRAGLLQVFYPGATPLQIEKLITEPLEEELAQIAEINNLKSTSRDNLVIVNIELKDYVYDTNAAWDRVKTAIERARLQFPEGVSLIDLDDRQIDMPAAVFSITGSKDPILLEEAALKLKREIIGLTGLSRIEMEGAPAKEVIIKLDQDTISRLGISRQYVAGVINQRNTIIPGGLISSKDKNIRLNTQSDFSSLDELRRSLIPLPTGQNVSLQTIASVKLEPRLPLTSQAFHNGQRAVSLGIIAERGQVDIIKFGQALRERVEAVKPMLAPLQIEESFFQPDYTQDRLDGLRANLVVSVLVIAAVVFFAMGWRTGLLVSAVLPIVSMITLGIYSAGGGVFHQMAVIGMVISLGILIDNAIVVVENIESSLRNNVDIGTAIRRVIHIMAKPLLASTGTTVAAFIPLLLADGGVGDFTRAVPTMIIIALIVSYLLSILVLPLISFYWLNNRKPGSEMAFQFTDKLAAKSADLVQSGPIKVLMVVGLLLGASLALSEFLKQEFFPSTDRAQIVIDLEMPNNTPLGVTERISHEIEQRLTGHDAVAQIYRNVGGAGFRFYYNIVGAPNESHVARLTINTNSEQQNQALVDWVRDEIKPDYPDAVLIPRLLGQGPPRPAPIEIRVKHRDLATLHSASQTIKELLANTAGVNELRSNLDLGTPELKLSIQEVAALSYGLTPNDVATAVYSESRGLFAGQYRYETDPVPIRVRSTDGQRSNLEVVDNLLVYSANQRATPLNQLAAIETAWAPSTLRHHNFDRTVTILSQVKPGFAFNQILSEFKEKLTQIELPAGISIEFGGDAAASEKANSSIATSAPLAVGLLIFFMMFQFNSFRRIGIVFVSIPLAAVGVIPGLVLSGQPFGFQSLLGVIALIGIVVNNAIVLIDVVDQQLNQGNEIEDAVRAALQQRTAPILLTTATTILGLLPLALSSSTLWPPMAWAIISGLTLSTMLTLIAIPSLCVLILGRKQNTVSPIRQTTAVKTSLATLLISVVSIGFITGTEPVKAAGSIDISTKTLDINAEAIIELVQNNNGVQASAKQAEAAAQDYKAQWRSAWAPTFTLGGEASLRDDASTIILGQPFGTLQVADKSAYVYEAKLTQPLFNPSQQRYATRAASKQAEIADRQFQARLHQATGSALLQYLHILSLQRVGESLKALESSLASRLGRIEKELNAGRVLKTDKLQVEVAVNRTKQQLLENRNAIATTTSALRHSLNLSPYRELSIRRLDTSKLGFKSKETSADSELSCLQRADCLAVELQTHVISAQQKSVKASFLPSLNLSLSEVRSDGQLFVTDKDRQALLEFSWPIFSGGQRLSKSNALKARKHAATSQLYAYQQQVQQELITAQASRANSVSQITLAKSSVALDEERLRLSRQRYEGGLLNIDELLDAEASLEQSKSELARARIGEQAAIVQIKLATGEDF